MIRLTKLVSVAGAAVLISACGGGGGGGGGGGAPAVPTAVTITAANSNVVGAEGFKGSDILTNTGNIASSVAGVVTTSTGSRFRLADFASRQLETLAARQFSSPALVAGVVTTSSHLCAGGGTVSTTLDDVDNNGRLSRGDTATGTFANCVEFGVVINGSFSINNVVVTGTPGVTPASSVGATFTFNNLSGQDSTSLATVNGNFNLEAATVNGVAFDITITGNNLSIAENGQTITLSNFSESLSVNRSTSAFSYTVNGTLTSTRLGGSLTFQTLTPFSGIEGAPPSSGVLKVTGANNTSLTLTALSSTSVRIDVDTNGDGVFDTSTSKTWSEIAAA